MNVPKIKKKKKYHIDLQLECYWPLNLQDVHIVDLT